LYAFDWLRLRKSNQPGHVVLPNQLLQILRPFLVVTTEFDKKFAATFAIPEFRTLATGYSTIASKVLGYLSTLADVTEETASRILANEVLLGKLRDVAIDAPEFKKTVDSALANDNDKLIKENQTLLKAIADNEKSREYVASALEEKKLLLAQQDRLLKEQRELAKLRKDEAKKHEQQAAIEKAARAQKAEEASDLRRRMKENEARVRKQGAELERAREESRKLRSRIRMFVGVVTFLLGSGVFLYLQVNWPWLQNHSKRLGLSLAVMVLWAAICWAIGDASAKRRKLALLSIAAGALFTLGQVMDSDVKAGPKPAPTTSPRP
jgi:hypothetical protein